MFDSHCHLADKQFADDLDEVLLRAEEHGVHAMIAIADDIEESKKCLELAEKYEQIFCTVGVHPHKSEQWSVNSPSTSSGETGQWVSSAIVSNAKAVAMGEIGLDYFYDNAPRDVQQHVFSEQLQVAKDLEYPAVIHNRDSFDDLWNIVCSVEPQKAVLHCCTEPWERVAQWIDRGYFLSFTGIATFPKSEEIRETIRQCPMEQLMIETDAPYLAPIPHRGVRNEPAYVLEVAKLVADLKGLSLQEVDEITTRNTVEFFRLGL